MPNLHPLNYINNADPKLINFITQVNQDIDKINGLIKEYNNTTSDKDSIENLKKILRYKQVIESKYSNYHVGKCPEFSTEIHENLYSKIKTEFAIYGITSLYGILDQTPPIPNTFAEIPTNMEQEKVNQLMDILAQGAAFDRNKLEQLYAPLGNAEFNQFLNKNSISYLGGNNSKNFKITPNDGSSPYVLKIENRLGMPKYPVHYLRQNALKEVLTPECAERQSKSGLNLVVTDFCSDGNLLTHSKNHGSDDLNRIKAAHHLYTQMLHIVMEMSQHGCAFPDKKNTNWMVEKNKLKISDTKSFFPYKKDGSIDSDTINKTTGGSFVTTQCLNPPEFKTRLELGAPISAEKMHAFMLGKNLYQYLTQCTLDELHGINDAFQFNFHYPIFQSHEGKKLMALIQDLVKYDPKNRISLYDAANRLDNLMQEKKQGENKLSLTGLEKEAQKILSKSQIKINGKTGIDIIGEFKNRNQQLIKTSNDLEIVEKLKDELTNILKYQKLEDIMAIIAFKNELQTILSNILEMSINDATTEEFKYGAQNCIFENTNNPENLMQLKDELAEMFHIQHHRLELSKEENRQLINQIQLTGFEDKDESMKKFIKEKESSIRNNLGTLMQLENDLKAILIHQKTVSIIKEIIQDLHKNTDGFNVNIDTIKQAMCDVPIEERGKIGIEQQEVGASSNFTAILKKELDDIINGLIDKNMDTLYEIDSEFDETTADLEKIFEQQENLMKKAGKIPPDFGRLKNNLAFILKDPNEKYLVEDLILNLRLHTMLSANMQNKDHRINQGLNAPVKNKEILENCSNNQATNHYKDFKSRLENIKSNEQEQNALIAQFSSF
ncbi:serine/threonine protein kinase [Legionella santicrucis]|uniref:Serine/threonine protein kinase n=1 Tax=Legionella santicrucis TaxID=45074 RepID=A0A0W0YHR1_9GAMM|nr:hypothetical protein [Legionella santicrucis]KTD56363.1 serine/threonine protein kinase [Legionella santicrucis]